MTVRQVTTKTQRWYEIDGVNYPSVTTPLALYAKPALMPWFAKLAAERAMPYIVGETALPTFRSPTETEDFRKHLSKAAVEATNSAGARGTAIHELIEAYVSGLEPEPKNRDEETQLAKYVEWQREAGFTPIAAELLVHSPRYGYAGLVDLVGYGPSGVPQILDIKTGSGVWPTYVLQLAAYRMADLVVHPDTNEWVEWQDLIVTDHDVPVGVLHIPEDGPVEVHYLTNVEEAFTAYLHILGAWQWSQNKEKKMVKRGLI